MLARFACALAVIVAPSLGHAAEPTLTFIHDGETLSLTTLQLLARPDAVEITVPDDVAYGGPMTYRAVPVLPLLTEAKLSPDETIDVKALDGFIAHLPAGVFDKKGPDAAKAFVAIEPPGAPWPKIKGKSKSAGPFYVVWLNAKASGIASEFWVYQVASFENALDPLVRWPQMDLAASVPKSDPARRGLTVFIENCLPCHKMNGGGESTVGPDLNLPMNPTEYFQPAALKTFIRDPESVRSWPDRQMTGFEVEAISDEDLDDLIAYLTAMRQSRP